MAETREFQYSNFARSTLAAGVTADGTEMFIQEVDEARFPNVDPTYDEIFSCILFTPDQTEVEIVYCTARAGTSMVVERAKENSTARAWPAGTLIIHNMTAQIFNDISEAGPREEDLIIALSSDAGVTDNKIMTSKDGTTWTMQTTPDTGDQWYGGAARPRSAGDALIVIVGDGANLNSVATSPDGINWTGRSTPDSRDWQDVAYSPTLDLFVAVSNDISGSNQVMTSPDGINWTLRTVPTTSANYRNILWSEFHSLFVIASTVGNSVLTSANGTSWTHNASGVNSTYSMAEKPSTGVIGASNRSDITCPTCSDPTAAWALSAAGWTAGMADIAYSPTLDRWVVVSPVAPRASYTSDPTAPWTNTLNMPNNNNWEGVVWAPEAGDNGAFVAVADKNAGGPSGKLGATSTDGISWTEQDTPVSADSEVFNSIFLAPITSG